MGADHSRAVVLAGGGLAGIAWMLGLAGELAASGLDLADADLIVGTSAGACVGAQLATGALEPAIAQQRRADSAELEVPFDLLTYIKALRGLTAGAPDERTALIRVANMEPLHPTIAEAQRRAVIAARLPVADWPAQRLLITVVDADAGELVTFDRDAGVELVDAVTASCALPGVWPAATIAGRRYVDGGARSPTNADLAAGHDAVVVVVPLALNDHLRGVLAAELAVLAPARTRVITADAASQAAFGPNPLDPSRRSAALDAGAAQARGELDELAAVWD